MISNDFVEKISSERKEDLMDAILSVINNIDQLEIGEVNLIVSVIEPHLKSEFSIVRTLSKKALKLIKEKFPTEELDSDDVSDNKRYNNSEVDEEEPEIAAEREKVEVKEQTQFPSWVSVKKLIRSILEFLCRHKKKMILMLVFLLFIFFFLTKKTKKEEIVTSSKWKDFFGRYSEANRNKDYEKLKNMYFSQFLADLPEFRRIYVLDKVNSNKSKYESTAIPYFKVHQKRLLSKEEIKKLFDESDFLKGEIEFIRIENPVFGGGFERVDAIFRDGDKTVYQCYIYHVTDPTLFNLKGAKQKKDYFLIRILINLRGFSQRRYGENFLETFQGFWQCDY